MTMKNHLKMSVRGVRAIVCGCVIGLAALVAPPASAQNFKTYSIVSGGTNNVGHGTTNQLGNTLAVSDVEYEGIILGLQANTATNGMTYTIPLYEGINGTIGSTSFTNLSIVANGTNMVWQYYEVSTRGAGFIEFGPFTNNAQASDVTNLTLFTGDKFPGRQVNSR
jgi:hypothetical protein